MDAAKVQSEIYLILILEKKRKVQIQWPKLHLKKLERIYLKLIKINKLKKEVRKSKWNPK